MNAQKSIQKIPDSELDIMLVLWSYDRPVRIIEIFNDLKPVRPCTKAAIHSLLENLRERGFVRIDYSPDRQSHKLITPLVSKEDYRASAAGTFVRKLCGGKWQTLVAELIGTNELSGEDIDELEEMLRKKKDK